jgi:hypothetical protein
MKNYDDEDYEDYEDNDEPEEEEGWSGDLGEILDVPEDNPQFLKGSNIPADVKYLTIIVTGYRRNPRFKSSYILDFKYSIKTQQRLGRSKSKSEWRGCKSYNVNQTHAMLLRPYMEDDNVGSLVGAQIVLQVLDGVWNPRKKKYVRSFGIRSLKLKGQPHPIVKFECRVVDGIIREEEEED